MIPILLLAWLAPLDDVDGLKSAIARTGDVDCDGVPDLLVARRGQAAVWILSGADGSPIRRLDGESRRFGTSIASVEDVDGDGVPDVIVGEPPGLAHVFSGADGRSLRRLESPRPDVDVFGSAVGGGGDVDADGTSDFLVGAPPERYRRKTEAGRAYLYSGRTGELARIVEGRFDFAFSWDPSGSEPDVAPDDRLVEVELGQSVAIVPDLDADGYDEVAVGCSIEIWNEDPSGNGASSGARDGYVEVLGGRDSALLHRFEATAEDRYGFAWTVGWAGDVDGDGAADLYTSSIHSVARVFSGRSGELLWSEDYGHGYLHAEGSSMDRLGDVDGDGFDDVAIGANESGMDHDPGFVEIRSGPEGELLWSWRPPTTGGNRPFTYSGEQEGIDVCGVGDVDGDERPDFALYLRRDRRLRMISGGSFELLYEIDLRRLVRER